MLLTLSRTLVWPFYVRNAGTFAVVVYFTFGFMRASDHKALIDAALASPFLLALVVLLWFIYARQTVSFIRKQLSAPEHRFLQTFWLMPAPTRFTYWCLLVVELLTPVLGYGGWMMIRAGRAQTWWSLTAIALTLVSLVTVGAWAADYRLRHPAPDLVRLPRLNVKLPYVLFFPTHWLRHHPVSVLMTKLISGGLLLGVCRLYPTDDYDERLLLIGLLLALITHSSVSRQLDAFESRYLLLLPNLPFSRWQRFGRYALIYGLIWLPELLILLRNCPADVRLDYVGWLWLTGWGWLLLLHSLAYGRSVSPERWQTGVFWGFIVGLLTIMFGLPVSAWLAVGWLGAVAGWQLLR